MKPELIAIFIFAYQFATIFKWMTTKKVVGWFPGGIFISFFVDAFLHGKSAEAIGDLVVEIVQVALPAAALTYATTIFMELI